MSGASKILMGSGGVDLPSDDEFNNVSFLSHFDGSNNGTNNVFDDGSDNNDTITAVGNSTQGTFGPFARPDGEWSTYFDGGDYLTPAVSSDFAFGTGDYTIEGWVSVSNTQTRGIFQLSNAYLNSTFNGPGFGVDATGGSNRWRWYTNGSSTQATHGSLGPAAGTWYHFAYVRNSGTSKVYIDGTEIFSATDSADYTNTYFLIGGWYSVSFLLEGHISNFRIVKGTAVYTSNFTAPTSALTAITNTKLLTCQSNRFKDNSSSAHAITYAGDPKVKAFTPILTSEVYASGTNGASAYFDGSGDYIYASSATAVGSGDFTIEFWLLQNINTDGYAFQYSAGVLDNKEYALSFYWSTSNRVYMRYGTSAGGGAGWTDLYLDYEQWNHIAIVRSSGTIKVYKNGVLGTNATISSSVDYSDTALVVGGGYSTAYLMSGYLSDFRVVKGTAVYTSSFTPPTAPLTKITNTELLLNMADGQALDSAAQNNVTLYGNADTSTSQQKFGTASLALDGTGDYLTFPVNTADFGSGDFTIECWAYRSDSATTHNCLLSVGGPSLYGGVQFYVYNNSLDFYAQAASGGYLVSNVTGPASSISADTWYHVAVVRNGTAFTCYVDGVGGTSATGSGAIAASTGNAAIGTYVPDTPNLFFAGYIDDFRISKFARYTSNFTPSTEAFPDKGQ